MNMHREVFSGLDWSFVTTVPLPSVRASFAQQWISSSPKAYHFRSGSYTSSLWGEGGRTLAFTLVEYAFAYRSNWPPRRDNSARVFNKQDTKTRYFLRIPDPVLRSDRKALRLDLPYWKILLKKKKYWGAVFWDYHEVFRIITWVLLLIYVWTKKKFIL